MKPILILAVILIYSLFIPSSVFALEAPVLTSPQDNSSVTTSTLNWQTPNYPLYTTKPYRVQVDDDPLFISLNKDYDTANTFYTPSLGEGRWYWRVRAKDNSGTPSQWSSAWSFTLTSATPTPSPTSTPTQIPTATPTPSPSSNFTITPDKSSISSFDILSVNVRITALDPNSKYYLKGAFIKNGLANYFGLTQVNGGWVKNSASYADQLPITTDSQGAWNGNIQVMVDTEDSGFTGSGDYIFKVGRYTQGGSGPTWSNEATINITGNTSGSGSASNSTPKPSSPALTKPSTSANNVPGSNLSKINYSIPDIAGISTKSSEPALTESDKQASDKKGRLNFWLLGAGFLVLIAGGGVLFHPKLKQKGIIPSWFSIQSLLQRLKVLPKN